MLKRTHRLTLLGVKPDAFAWNLYHEAKSHSSLMPCSLVVQRLRDEFDFVTEFDREFVKSQEGGEGVAHPCNTIGGKWGVEIDLDFYNQALL